ncbi:hypothetical protein MTP99_001892 [Tenebrio molitor]|nr:hypothetical protein MTP99_001892 [Tenebrio molitor]
MWTSWWRTKHRIFDVVKYFVRNSGTVEDTPIVSLAECRRFVIDCMIAVGTPKHNAERLADNMVEADYRGLHGHGINRIEMFLSEVQHGSCDAAASPEVLNETAATAWVEGNNGLGPVVGSFCMNLAIDKAKNLGVGLVACKGSNHFGIGTTYVIQALKKDLVGLCFSNTSPVVAPTRARCPAIGTNPLSVAAPGMAEDNFVLDMATSVVSRGKIEMRRKMNVPVPLGWADPLTGALRPLGSTEENSSYKGYGLAICVEILCGILAGGHYGPYIHPVFTTETEANLAQCFVAIDPCFFAPGFQERLTDLTTILRNLEPSDPRKPVQVAGDTQRVHMKMIEENGGIKYSAEQLKSCENLAKSLDVKPLRPIKQ